MSFVSDALGFEAFHTKDLWNRLKKDPKRIVLGVDPLSTKAWNAVLGKHDKPLVDQLGGAYGGHTISAFGNQDGGVYKRAEDAGINTNAGKSMQDAAHVVAAIFGAQGLSGIGGNSGAPAGNDLGIFSNGGTGGMGGVGGGKAGALANSGGIEGGAGMGSATEAAPMDWQSLAKQGLQQQQQSSPQQRQRAAAIRGQSQELEHERQKADAAEAERRRLFAAAMQVPPSYSPV